ncbi:MAG TPA: hypothetical protein VLG40_03215 [Candidatus Saccharimonas sp.]|nr:hypothetical protein [Candidatus Saccharimonas sp.]
MSVSTKRGRMARLRLSTEKRTLKTDVKQAKADRDKRIADDTPGEGGLEPRTDAQIKKAVDGNQPQQ